MSKEVKIIGLSIGKDFGGLKATQLKFDEKNKLTIFKGEVGAGKTTLNRAIRLTTQGSAALEDKSLYGDVEVTTQLSDDGLDIYVGCRSTKDGKLTYFLYTLDENGKKNKGDVVVDGEKLTPAGYLSSLQTALTWRMEELTSENPTTQRNILLELYKDELQEKGVIFDKAHPNYVGSILDKIEKAKQQRSYMDMKRKEVGGIADDMQKKGIDFESRIEIKSNKKIEEELSSIKAKITLAKTNASQAKENKLNELKASGSEIGLKLKVLNDEILKNNKNYNSQIESYSNISSELETMGLDENQKKLVIDTIKKNAPVYLKKQELEFNEKGTCTTKSEDFSENKEIFELISEYEKIIKKYIKLKGKKAKKANVKELKSERNKKQLELDRAIEFEKTAKAVNSFHDWRDADSEVKDIKKDYFMKLTEISTGVEGLYISPEYIEDDDGSKIAKDNNIFLMYDGSYDPKYFNNKSKDLRKLSSYSGTQKPMICLLIQNYLLSKKNKTLPYLWIDNVPIDKKTKELLNKMAEELGLWLFVNWTGDFKAKNLKNGEVLIENGEILLQE